MQLEMFEAIEDAEHENLEGEFECIECKEMKPTSEYYTYSYCNIAGSTRRCKPCYNANTMLVHRLKKTYPYPHRNPVCDCCGTLSTTDKLQLDHNHTTKKFRGYLCRSCNIGIGNLGDTVEGLTTAIEYLKRCNDG